MLYFDCRYRPDLCVIRHREIHIMKFGNAISRTTNDMVRLNGVIQ